MIVDTHNWLFRRRWILAAVGLPVLVVLWWAFRPEKLWINEKVNEPAPFETGADPQPILTGRFESEGQTGGRATIYKKSGGEYLRLSDFTAPVGDEINVVLSRSTDIVKDSSQTLDCGPLKSNQSDQNYDLPAATDVAMYKAVVIYSERSGAVYGVAKLEPF